MTRPEPRSYFAATASFATGEDSPREFLERCIAKIEAGDGEVGAFVAVNPDAARAAADEASARWKDGRPLSAIDGMPVGIKDIMETADMATEQGSPLFAGWEGGRDAAAVAALREAGAVILGKTVTTEFAATEPRGTRNPWDLTRTPGGSSSGSAASVACGMVPAALGTQVIGSILRPSSYCGVFGFKPSVGGINRGGSFDVFSQSCTGTIAATVDETWVVAREMSARCGGDPGYPGVSGPMVRPAARRPGRIAVLETAGWEVAGDAAKGAFASVRERLEAAGIECADRRSDETVAGVEDAIADAVPLARSVNAWETRWPLNTYAKDMDRSGLSEVSTDRLAEAEGMTQEQYLGLLADRDRARAAWAGLAGSCEICITLGATGPAPVGLDSTGDPVFNVPASLLGIPALTMPVMEVDGLPLGLQAMGFVNQDAALFGAAAGLLTVL
ncbi:MAG: amidase [Defluviicoccus sp.]|nr:amidase [Defluviicoccus sp.]MDE0279187.1 amidase [Defluviicoccus sp.]